MSLSSAVFDKQKKQCVQFWKDWLDHDFKLVTPEALVNDAWRAMLIGNLMIAVGDRPHYSAGNAYAKLYEGECGDTLRSLMLFGHLDVGPGMLKSMLEFNRKDTQFHVADEADYTPFFWLTQTPKPCEKFTIRFCRFCVCIYSFIFSHMLGISLISG